MDKNPPTPLPVFTPRAFARVVAKVMFAFAALMLVLFFLVRTLAGPENLTAFTMGPLGYLAFILGWAVAYTQFFRFPERQRVLLVGVGIGGVLLAISGFFTQANAPSLEDPRFNIPGFLGGFAGCAMQLYFLAIMLRFVPFLRPRL